MSLVERLQNLPADQLGVWAPLFAVSALAWFLYFRTKEPRAHPLWLRWAALGAGAVGALGAWLGYGALETLGVSVQWEDLASRPWPVAARSALWVGGLEEGATL